MIAKCDCANEYQDKRYGKGRRVHNPCKLQGGGEGKRCAVCLKETPR